MINFDEATPEWRVVVRRHPDDPWKPVAWIPVAKWDNAVGAIELLRADAKLRKEGSWPYAKIEERWCTPWQDPE